MSAARWPDPDDGADHYAVLGLRYDATPVEVTRAYRRAMKLNHPDLHQADDRERAETRARRINAAHATLSRPGPRRLYDQTLQSQAVADDLMGRYVNGGFDPGDIQRAGAAARPTMRRPMTARERRERRRGELTTYVSLGLAFGGFVAGIVLVLLALALFGSLVRIAF